ncbi:glycerol-3-phosphate phosphatase-like [Vespula maculifrons]|uniref:Glycerol-3-phosphate phosphatase-like n=1 Tax=Vespula maculifrons TaxID=7453 RepID=A0ABD2AVX2_VESMC
MIFAKMQVETYNNKMAAVNFKTLKEEEIIKFFNSFDTVLTDCDGVLWMHMTPLKNASTVISKLHALGNRVFYITNNSTKTLEEFMDKCKILEFEVSKDNILCTANLSAKYLHKLGFSKKAYVIGSEAITKELEKVGISHYGVGPDVINPDISCSYTVFNKDPEVGAVIVGFDEHFSYPKMVKAVTYLNDPNVHFIGTNTDERFQLAQSIVIPGTGSLIRCIESCTERKALIMGKPEPYIANILKERYNVNPARTLMIGDRCNTDILLGTRYGFKTLLVLTGVTNLQQVEQWKQSNKPEEKELVPDYYIDALGDLLYYIELFTSKSKKNINLETAKI